MKKILPTFLLLCIISCSEDKKIMQREDLIGEWKEVQRRPTRKAPIYDIPDCGHKKANGEFYIFKADSTYTVKNICPGGEPEEKGTWVYRDNIISMMRGEYNYKLSVLDEGNKRVKFAVISAEKNGISVVDFFKMGTYSIFEKQ